MPGQPLAFEVPRWHVAGELFEQKLLGEEPNLTNSVELLGAALTTCERQRKATVGPVKAPAREQLPSNPQSRMDRMLPDTRPRR